MLHLTWPERTSLHVYGPVRPSYLTRCLFFSQLDSNLDLLKFKYSEKATKIRKKSPNFIWLYLSKLKKTLGDFFFEFLLSSQNIWTLAAQSNCSNIKWPQAIGESKHCAVSSLLFLEKLTVCTVHTVRVGLITTCNRMQRKLALLTPLQSVNFLRDWLPDRKKLRLLRRVLR